MRARLRRSGAWQSLSGVRLDAIKLTRGIYMDESGTSRNERLLAVVGVIVHADTQLGPIETRLRELTEKYIAPEQWDTFVFHAADRPKDDPMLDEVLAIPKELSLPVCGSFIGKEMFRKHYPNAPEHKRLVAMHAAAIANCTLAAELWMRTEAPSEVAWIFAEDNDEVKKAAKRTQMLMRQKGGLAKLALLGHERKLPLVKIKDTISFAAKEESPALQLADACAWTYRKWLTKKDDQSLRLYAILEPQIDSHWMTTLDATRRLS